ncbi:hypothetical protein T265_10031 [Opisthorchis viverrini]|uniref:Uncharacterized protein n=1 Tax=Opisthorchis viverrini TaxID=6198 RepID=A0A074Z3U0_OPIVI|nr:hypothetical protein T265_10031 [Opisthorchis viverrini]KER21703.1 hypothetical protein T265_10031 [Opisthorchis viverrini]
MMFNIILSATAGLEELERMKILCNIQSIQSSLVFVARPSTVGAGGIIEATGKYLIIWSLQEDEGTYAGRLQAAITSMIKLSAITAKGCAIIIAEWAAK